MAKKVPEGLLDGRYRAGEAMRQLHSILTRDIERMGLDDEGQAELTKLAGTAHALTVRVHERIKEMT